MWFLLQCETRELEAVGMPAWQVGTVTPLVGDSHLWLSLGVEPRSLYLFPFYFCGNLGNVEADFLVTTRNCSFKGIKDTLSWQDGVSKWPIEIYYISGHIKA